MAFCCTICFYLTNREIKIQFIDLNKSQCVDVMINTQFKDAPVQSFILIIV